MTVFATIKPSNIVVLFPPGSGGNFLIRMIAQKYIFSLASKNNPALVVDFSSTQLKSNEYSSDFFPIIAPRHLNQFFMLAGGMKAGEPVYSLSRYREILSAYRYSKFIIVHTSGTERVYCECLNVIKTLANNGDKFRIDLEQKSQVCLNDIKNKFEPNRRYSKRRPHHYREISKWLKKQGTHVLDVEYQQLFPEPSVEIYHNIGGFVSGNMGLRDIIKAESVVKEARLYHRENQKLIRQFVAEHNLKSLVKYTAVKNPGATQ